MGSIGPGFNPSSQRYISPQQRPATGEAANAMPTSSSAGAAQASLVQTGSLFSGGDARLLLAPLFAFQNALDAQQTLLLLRNLLQMPDEMVRLLALSASAEGENVQDVLKQLQTEDVKVPLEALQELLKTNGAKGQEKLMKLLQSSQMTMTGSGGQMGDLMNSLGEMVSRTGKSPTEALHTAMSLYLPFYPLQPPQQFTLRFEALPEDEQGGAEDPQLVLYLETITMGSFRISLGMEAGNRLHASIEHDAVATSGLETIIEESKSCLLAENMSNVVFESRQRPQSIPQNSDSKSLDENTQTGMAQSSTNPERKQAVALHPAKGVSALTIQAAYVLIRVIFELDNRNKLHLNRQDRLMHNKKPHE